MAKRDYFLDQMLRFAAADLPETVLRQQFTSVLANLVQRPAYEDGIEAMPSQGYVDFRLLQDMVRRIFEGLARQASVPDALPTAINAPSVSIKVTQAVWYPDAWTRSRRRIVLVTSGTADQILLCRLLARLAECDVPPIRPCAVCGRLFVRRGRRLICGRKGCDQARDAKNWQRYSQTSKGRAAKRRRYDAHGWTVDQRKGVKKGTRKKSASRVNRNGLNDRAVGVRGSA